MTETKARTPGWECQECGGELNEQPGREYEYANCLSCGLRHAWDDDDARWFSLDVYDGNESA